MRSDHTDLGITTTLRWMSRVRALQAVGQGPNVLDHHHRDQASSWPG